MTPHKTRTNTLAAAGISLATAFSVCGTALILTAMPALVACEKKKEAPPPPPPPPPPPKSPDPIELAPVIQSAKPDARVHFAQAYAPTDESLARAVIGLADALARGDSSKFGSHLTPESKADLDALTSSGGWEEGTAKIEDVRVINLSDLTPGGPGGGPGGSGASTGATIQLAVQDPTGAYLLAWEAVKVGDTWAFKGIDAPSETKRRASEFDSAAGNDAAAAAGQAAPAPAAGPVAAAAGNDLAQAGQVAFYVYHEAKRRIADAAGSKANDASSAALLSQFVPGGTKVDDVASAGKKALKSGTPLADQFFPIIFNALKAEAAGSATDDQILQHIANITGVAERMVRMKATGGAGAPGAGAPRNSRGG